MDKSEMLALRLDGLTYAEVAVQAGLSRQRVQQILSPPPSIRNYVVDRAKGLCQVCELKVGIHGHVHHIGDNGDDYNDLVNLQLLCISCHRSVHPGMPKRQKVKPPSSYLGNLRANLEPPQTQAVVAEAVGMSEGQYGRLERGEHLPRIPTLIKLGAFYKIGVRELRDKLEEAGGVING